MTRDQKPPCAFRVLFPKGRRSDGLSLSRNILSSKRKSLFLLFSYIKRGPAQLPRLPCFQASDLSAGLSGSRFATVDADLTTTPDTCRTPFKIVLTLLCDAAVLPLPVTLFSTADEYVLTGRDRPLALSRDAHIGRSRVSILRRLAEAKLCPRRCAHPPAARLAASVQQGDGGAAGRSRPLPGSTCCGQRGGPGAVGNPGWLSGVRETPRC